MKYIVHLVSPAANGYLAQRAADSVDLDVSKKLTHHLEVEADLDSPFNVGVIVGSSGSGKTTLARQVYGDQALETVCDPSRPVIEQFPAGMTYDAIVDMLTGVGLHQVPCWIRPVATLSNGQRFRAEVALQMARGAECIVIDEWTSVVDRTVAKAMSHTIQKHARRTRTRVVLLSCHYDVIEWLQPDWVIDCNEQSFTDWRSERPKREEHLTFEVAPCHPSTWRFFSKYHYLSENLPGGFRFTYGLYHQGVQIGFQCFAEYTPWRDKKQRRKLHSNRVVVHPDYCGLGLGIKMTTLCAEDLYAKGYEVMAKLSSVAMVRAREKHPNWRLENVQRTVKVVVGGNMVRKSGFREQVKTYSFRFVPNQSQSPKQATSPVSLRSIPATKDDQQGTQHERP